MTIDIELDDMQTDVYPELQKLTKDIQRALKDEILPAPQSTAHKQRFDTRNDGKTVHVNDRREWRK